MHLHRGRLIDHIHLRVAGLEASKRFYLAVADVLGLPGVPQTKARLDELLHRPSVLE